MKRLWCRVLLLLSLSLTAGVAAAEPQLQVDSCATPNLQLSHDMSGFREVILSVRDLDIWVDTLVEVGGWRAGPRLSLSPAQLQAWGLDASLQGEQQLLRNGCTQSGFVRLVRLSGQAQRRIRSNDQSWDSGAIFDLNMRVTNMARTFEALQARNWQAVSDPVEFQFGKFHVKEWIVAGPDGVRLALIERIAPTLEGWPELRGFSRVFNSTQIVTDMDGALGFYRDLLGWQQYMEHHGASSKAGPNVLGLPHNLAKKIPRHVYILHPQGTNEGSIELLSFEGATGADFSAGAWLPNLGIAGLRIPVEDIAGLRQRLLAADYPVAAAINELDIAPYGRVKTLLVVAPGGVRLEFMEYLDQQ